MKKLLLGLVLVFATLFTNVLAEDKPRAVIIFDASGSMWGQINGVTKLEIARDALKNVVKEWNPNVELGLTVYGHRSKGDCNDIETVIPVGKIDKERVIKIVMGIKPKGKTPISRSLRKVAEEIKYTEEKATIILISDGKETCDPDPCGTAKELEAQGIDFVTHVIGFNVDKKTDKQLECIASATGGEYFSAKNAAALNKAMKVIAKKVEVVVPPKPVVKKLKNNLEVTASEKEGGKWVEASHVIVKIIDGEEEDSRTEHCYSYKKKECIEQIAVGNYIIHSTYNEFKKDTKFEIKAGEVTKVHVAMGQTGTIETSASEKEGGKWIAAYHIIVHDEGGKAGDLVARANSQKKNVGKRQIPVGKYILESSYDAFKKETPFEIKADEVTKIHVVFEQFRIETKCTDMNSQVSYEVYASSGRMVYDAKKSCSQAVQLTLDAGDYTVEASIGSDKKEEKFTIGAGVSKLLIDMTTIKKEPTKEELIKADTQASTPVKEEPKSKKISIGDKQIEITGVSEKEVEQLKNLGAILGAFGGMVKGADPEEQKKQEEKKSADNAKADQEFDDMSKELEMFTK